MSAYTQHIHSGRLFCDGVEVPQDDRHPDFRAYLSWLSAGGGVVMVQDPAPAQELAEELAVLAEAKVWGTALVRDFEAAAMRAGVNQDPRSALALYRFLEPVRTPLREGLLHVAFAALQELLEVAPEDRPPLADLTPIYQALAARLGLSVVV